jgi:hypothetical protein
MELPRPLAFVAKGCHGGGGAGTIVGDDTNAPHPSEPRPTMSTPAEPPPNAPHRGWDQLAAHERRVVDALLQRKTVARDTNRMFLDDRTFG